MKINLKKYSVEQYLVFLLIFFTFGIIGSKTIRLYRKDVVIEISLVVGSLFLFFRLFKLFKIKKERKLYLDFIKENKFFTLFISVFSIFSLSKILTIYWKDYPYVITKIFPYILFFFLMVYLKNEKREILKKYLKFSAYIFIVSFALAILMYIMGYTNGAFSLTKGIKLVSKAESMNLFGEARLYWLLSHKSRFVIYCALGFLIILKSGIKNKILLKTGIVLSLICVIFSNSMTGIAVYLVVVVFYFVNKYKVIEKLFKSKHRNKILTGALVFIIIFSAGFITMLGNKRNLATLGDRTIIWESSVKKIKEKPFGIGKMPNKYWIVNTVGKKKFYFTNAHNIYLNEIIENGVILGAMYLAFNIFIILKLIKLKDYNFAMFMFLTLFVFGNLESINSREMNYILFLAYGIFYSLASRKENLTLVRGTVDE